MPARRARVPAGLLVGALALGLVVCGAAADEATEAPPAQPVAPAVEGLPATEAPGAEAPPTAEAPPATETPAVDTPPAEPLTEAPAVDAPPAADAPAAKEPFAEPAVEAPLAAEEPLAEPLGEEPLAEPAHVVEYADDTLTVRLEDVPVSTVLEEIGRQSGAEIRGQVREPRQVSAEFRAVPLPEALHRLLGEQNFALVYGDGGRLRAVKLLGGPQPVTAAVKPPAPAAPPQPAVAPVSPAALAALFERQPPLPISGRLADVIGADSATFMQLVNEGLHNDDPIIRLEAVRTVLQAVEAQQELRVSVLGAVSAMPEADVGTFFRNAAGEKAEEIAMHIASQARSSEVRTKASVLLRELRRTRQAAGG